VEAPVAGTAQEGAEEAAVEVEVAEEGVAVAEAFSKASLAPYRQ
jgi:hypothetical protein